MTEPLVPGPDSPHGVSRLMLERYLLGELSPAERARVESLRDRLREELETLKASNKDILAGQPPEDFVRRLRVRAEAEARVREASKSVGGKSRAAFSGSLGAWRPWPLTAAWRPWPLTAAWRPLWGSLALLALLAAPAWFALRQPQPVSETAPETTRIKGLEPRLAVFRKTERGAEPVEPGEKAHAGEFLRIGYQAGGYPYGAILSVDGNGNVTRHWPEAGDRAGRLKNGETLLPAAFELDAAPDFERFYFVVSERPFDLNPLLDSLHRHESLRSPSAGSANTRIVRFEILKENGI